jgi:(p)ppGpp synthase/HD superfamily hydrolase
MSDIEFPELAAISYAVKLPDGKILSFDHIPTLMDVANRISPQFAKQVVAGRVNGEPQDLSDPIKTTTEAIADITLT